MKIDLKAINNRLRKKLANAMPLSKELRELALAKARLEAQVGHLSRQVRSELGPKKI